MEWIEARKKEIATFRVIKSLNTNRREVKMTPTMDDIYEEVRRGVKNIAPALRELSMEVLYIVYFWGFYVLVLT